jgi:hypothetical protein
MKTKTYKILLMTLMVMGLVTYSCADLNVENLVEPDSGKALKNPDDLKGVAGGAYKVIHTAAQDYDGPAMAMAGMADQTSCSWGNAAMRDLGKEPRLGYNNSKTYAYYPVVSKPWAAFYSSISSVNDVLTKGWCLEQTALIQRWLKHGAILSAELLILMSALFTIREI